MCTYNTNSPHMPHVWKNKYGKKVIQKQSEQDVKLVRDCKIYFRSYDLKKFQNKHRSNKQQQQLKSIHGRRKLVISLILKQQNKSTQYLGFWFWDEQVNFWKEAKN